MDRIVSLLAPQTHIQTFGLFLFVQVLIGLAGLSYDVGVHGIPAEALMRNILGTFIVAAPFILLGLVMLRHQKVLQDKLAQLADTDALTGLLNRRAFLARVTQDGSLVSAGALMVLDVDHFKQINDEFGHEAGDRCLAALAQRLEDVTGGQGHIARLGGDEFVIFLPEPDQQTAHRIGKAIAAGFEIMCGQMPCRITLAVGAVMAPKGAVMTTCLRAADIEMFSAKRQGRARFAASKLNDGRPIDSHTAALVPG